MKKQRTLSMGGALFAAALFLVACGDDDHWHGRTVHSVAELEGALGQSGEIQIPSGTQLVVNAQMTVQSGETLFVREGASIAGDGKLDVNGTLVVEGQSDLDRISVNGGAVVQNEGTLHVDDLDLNGGQFSNAGVLRTDDLTLNGGSTFDNRGRVVLEELVMNGGSLTNLGEFVVSDDLTVNGGSRIDNGSLQADASAAGNISFAVRDQLTMNGGLIWNSSRGTIRLNHLTMHGGSQIDNTAGGTVAISGRCDVQVATAGWSCPR